MAEPNEDETVKNITKKRKINWKIIVGVVVGKDSI